MTTVMYIAGRSFNLVRSRFPLMRLMRDRGCRVVAVASEQPELTSELVDAGIEFVPAEMSHISANPLRNLRALRNLGRIIKITQPDLIHVFNPTPILMTGMLRNVSQLHASIVATFTGLGFERNKSLSTRVKCCVFRTACRKIDAVTFETSADERYARNMKMFGHQPSLVSLSTGVNLENHVPLIRNPDGQMRFLFASRLLWSKGIGELVEAAAILKRQYPDQFRLIIAGEVEHRHKDRVPQQYIDENARAGLFQYVGTRTLAEMPSLYNESDVVVLPSYREGFSRVLIEAAAMGKPLVATDIPGCREAMVENESGRLVQKRSVESLTNAMKFFLDHPESVLTYGKRSRALALANFCDQRLAERALQFYCEQGFLDVC